jgi:hypothetical protein
MILAANMNKCLILGCSHANGAEMFRDPEFNISQYNFVEQVEYGARNSYPVLLAEQLGYHPLNHSISGGSNDAMYRIAQEQIHNLTDQDIVIACWTGVDRGELWHEEHCYWRPVNYNNNQIHQLSPNEYSLEGINIGAVVDRNQDYHEYAKQWMLFQGNYQRGFYNKIKNVLALNCLTTSRGIRTVNLDSFQSFNSDKFTWPEIVYRPFDKHEDEFCNFCLDRDYPHEPNGHFFRPAHEAYSKHVYNHIKDTF